MREARILSLLWPLLKRCAWSLPATILLGIASALAESAGLSLFVPLLQSLERKPGTSGDPDSLRAFYSFVQHHIPAGNPLPYIAGLILAMTAAKNLLMYSHSILAARINSRITHRVRCQVFSKLLAMSRQAMDAAGTGRLINILATGTWHTSDAISLVIGMVINVCAVMVFCALLMMLSLQLTVFVILGVILISMLLQIVTMRARRLGHQAVESNAILSDHMLDALDGIREIQMYGLKADRCALFDAVSSQVKSIYLKLDLLHRAVSPLSETLYVTLLLGLLMLGVTGKNSAPAVVVFLLVLYRLQPQIRQLDSNRLSLVALTGSVAEVSDVLNARDPVVIAVDCQPDAVDAPDIEFRHVSFSYDSEREYAAQDVSFFVPFGRVTAIVGPSGSGKTTLVSLLCRFYEPASGCIRAAGEDISRIAPDKWRSGIAWVSQDAYIFSATVRENIRYGATGASDAEVHAAAKHADVDSFVTHLPEGYDTKIGNGGARLSSGQVQRIALARAFVRNPSLLILDEATNALDSISEELIRRRLHALNRHCTVIVISHRLSTVSHADQVIVLSKGRVVEQGAPSELMTQRGFLSRLRELQHVE